MTALVMAGGCRFHGLRRRILLLQKDYHPPPGVAACRSYPPTLARLGTVAYQYGALNQVDVEDLAVAVSTLDNAAVSAQRRVRLFAPVLGFTRRWSEHKPASHRPGKRRTRGGTLVDHGARFCYGASHAQVWLATVDDIPEDIMAATSALSL